MQNPMASKSNLFARPPANIPSDPLAFPGCLCPVRMLDSSKRQVGQLDAPEVTLASRVLIRVSRSPKAWIREWPIPFAAAATRNSNEVDRTEDDTV